MHGPRDVGPTQTGQTVMDFVLGKLPGIVPATFAFRPDLGLSARKRGIGYDER